MRDFPQGAQRIPINYFFCAFPLCFAFCYVYIQTSCRAQDEIGALASSHSSTAVDSSTLEGVLLTLLNKMDGLEELARVTVINMPEALMHSPVHFIHCCTVPPLHAFLCQDPVLMRPRRLDCILYVGLPDFAG